MRTQFVSEQKNAGAFFPWFFFKWMIFFADYNSFNVAESRQFNAIVVRIYTGETIFDILLNVSSWSPGKWNIFALLLLIIWKVRPTESVRMRGFNKITERNIRNKFGDTFSRNEDFVAFFRSWNYVRTLSHSLTSRFINFASQFNNSFCYVWQFRTNLKQIGYPS